MPMARLEKMPFDLDRLALALLVIGSLLLTGWRWLADHPQHNPWAPLVLDQPEGWATRAKLARLRDGAECRAFLRRSDIGFSDLPPIGEGECRRSDRMVLKSGELDAALRPDAPQSTCAVQAALAYWLYHEVQPAAREHLGSPVAAIEHIGTFNCRRIGSGEQGGWSEHATGNAVDIAAVTLADGRRVEVATGWDGDARSARFLRRVRDGACRSFATVLSPDYNAAHADHLHLDQAGRRGGGSFCR